VLRSHLDPDDLIQDAAEGRCVLTDAELRFVLEHVAAAGFDPHARERVRGRLAGMTWRGAILRGRDRLPPAEVKFLAHVVAKREWPEGTDPIGYLESLGLVILDARNGVFTCRYQGTTQLGVVRESGALRGPDGGEWILIEYRAERRHWVTAFQPGTGLSYLNDPGRSDFRWLRQPEHSSERPRSFGPSG